MDKLKIEPLSSAYRLLNPGGVALISVGDGETDNLFSVNWNMPIRKDPPMVTILSGKRHYSYPFIERTGEFGLNIPDASLVEAVHGCGSISGKDGTDKFIQFGLSRQEAACIKAPLVKETVANLECRVCQVVDLGVSALLIAQVVNALAAPKHFQNGNWTFENGLKLLQHLGDGKFAVTSGTVTAKQGA